MKLYLAVIFVSVKLLGETFPEGISNGVRGCDISVPFSRRTVALAGVFTMVRFVGLTAITDVAVLMANKITKVTPKITYWLFIIVICLYGI
jgi:hypothetical protein